MTRFLHLADIHLGRQQYGVSQRTVDAKLSFQYALSQVSAKDADAVLLPGDLFDSQDVRPETLASVEEVLANVKVPVIVSPGNHDQNMSRRRNLTWLQYLNNKGLITLLSANFEGDRASFAPTDVDSPRNGGGGYVDLETDEGTVRVFGVQYRGAYMEQQIPAVVDGIEAVNASEGEPAATVVLAHFGVDDAVPDLGATVSVASLTPLMDAVDYVALGHIHKRYEVENVYNPGSLEAFSVQEGRWDDAHGYYVVDASDWSAEHRVSKRRPYVTIEFDVSGYRTFDDLRAAFEGEIRDEQDMVERVCSNAEFQSGDGSRRDPIVNLRLTGTLLLDHAAFDIDALRDAAGEMLDALYVQPTDNTERKAVQELLGDIDREEAFAADGTVNTDALQERVFTTLAEESRYSAAADDVAATLDELEGLVTEDDAGVGETASYLRERRRELFPDGVGEDEIGDSGEAAAAEGGEAE
ncbi:DNA repair exonuclease [Halorubrum sp. RMP-47]|uniref:metallophosphoesterase family protein n=1 Tax=Halorubrum miltondacostae TaxID=3076378 RepID=UPI003527B944